RKRCRNETSMIQLSTELSPSQRTLRELPVTSRPGLSFVAPAPFAEVAFQEFRPEDGTALGGDDLASQDADDDLGVFLALGTGADLAELEELGGAISEKVLVADKDDLAVAVGVDRVVGNNQRVLLFAKHNPTGAKHIGTKPAVAVVHVGPDLNGAGLLINSR